MRTTFKKPRSNAPTSLSDMILHRTLKRLGCCWVTFHEHEERGIELKAWLKILLYAPEENLADGAAKYSSKGFFDVDNVPPWDTWLTFSNGILLSWVPELLVGLAQNGIDANPEGCIRWLD